MADRAITDDWWQAENGQKHHRRAAGIAAILLFAGVAAARAQPLGVSLAPSLPSPSPVGTIITWSAATSGNSGLLWYRFRARRAGGDFRTVRDYSPDSSLDWTASEHEGLYEIQVTARDTGDGTTADVLASYRMTSLAGDTSAVITPTANPLVFLYSAPPCPLESRMRVSFQSPAGFVQYTPYQSCRRGLSMNFYLAGLRANATYSVWHTIDTGSDFRDGPALTLTTPGVSVKIPVSTLLQAPASPAGGVLLHCSFFGPSYATDRDGNLIWFYPASFSLLTRPEPGGRFLALIANHATTGSGRTLREIDVAGNTIRETNTARVNEQLTARGVRNIGVFHHEALGLPDDKIAVLGATEQILTGVQGSGAVDVIGDMIVVLDRDLQVVWTWDAFDHLDPHRLATLGETCPGSGCPPISLASHANDWLHGNALQFTNDGNILYSTRHQDWIVKIDFNNGEGAGDVIWRLGKDGDFQMNSSDPRPWFSHQHGPQLAAGDDTTLAVFDDSNLRQNIDDKAHSRGQVLRLNEQDKTVSLLLNVDLGGFSFAVGNAQPLPAGNFHFGGGWLPDDSSLSLDADPSGNVVGLRKVKSPEYRSFRMRDLYTVDYDIAAPLQSVSGSITAH